MTENPRPDPVRILVDADGCPVRSEIFKVASRLGAPVVLVSNACLRIPRDGSVTFVKAGDGLDAADDWIAGNAGPADVVVTADIPLAGRVLKTGAAAVDPRGRAFTEDSIGGTLATRNLMAALREAGAVTGGPSAFSKADRSRFLHGLDEAVRKKLAVRPSGQAGT
jgi:hypothetical protein